MMNAALICAAQPSSRITTTTTNVTYFPHLQSSPDEPKFARLSKSNLTCVHIRDLGNPGSVFESGLSSWPHNHEACLIHDPMPGP